MSVQNLGNALELGMYRLRRQAEALGKLLVFQSAGIQAGLEQANKRGR